MRKIAMTTLLMLLASAMAFAQSVGDQAQGAAQGAGSAVQNGAETGYNKTKEGAQKAYGATKNTLTGSSDQQNSSDQNQTDTTGTQGQAHHAGKLPQTASPLPLLGLLGLGATALGAWKRRWLR